MTNQNTNTYASTEFNTNFDSKDFKSFILHSNEFPFFHISCDQPTPLAHPLPPTIQQYDRDFYVRISHHCGTIMIRKKINLIFKLSYCSISRASTEMHVFYPLQ